MSLTILRVNPLEYEVGLKALMTSHEVPYFTDFFDRGYASAVQDGARSWVGLDESGEVQMSITSFVHQFDFGGRTVVGGMLGNLMVATPYRTFFPAVALLKRVVADSRAHGEVDFLYGDPGPKGAQAIFQGAKVKQVGMLDRFVIPLGDAVWHRHLAALAYSTTLRLTRIRHSAQERCVRADAEAVRAIADPWESTDLLQPWHTVDMYRRRLYAFPSAEDHLVALHRHDGEGPPLAMALLRGPERGIVSAYVLRRRRGVSIRSLVPALIRVSRQLGGLRIQVETVVGSRLAGELLDAGFTARNHLVPICAVAFTPIGEEAVRSTDRWEIAGMDVER